MPPSYARPPSNPSIRTPAGSSIRPPSSATSNSLRPSSSASLRGPASSLSVSSRPDSRISQRPSSRISQRPPTSHSQRPIPLIHELVTQVTKLSEEERRYREAVEIVSKHVGSMKTAPTWDMAAVGGKIKGHVLKARIHAFDSIADALQETYARLKSLANSEAMDSTTKARLPEHLQFLLLLSSPPSPEGFVNADNVLLQMQIPATKPPTLTWKDILAEEPFEGQHWQGAYGMMPGSVKLANDDENPGESDSSLSPFDSDLSDFEPPDHSPTRTSFHSDDEIDVGLVSSYTIRPPNAALFHRQQVEELEVSQYWKPEWRQGSKGKETRPFDIGDPSTLGSSFTRALAQHLPSRFVEMQTERERTIYEHDVVREVLLGMQGRNNAMLSWHYQSDGRWHDVQPSSSAPRLSHLTLGAQQSILSSFAAMATTLSRLRVFTSAVMNTATEASHGEDYHGSLSKYNRRRCRTLEAFADSTDRCVRAFEAWCAEREEEITIATIGAGPSIVVSLLSLDKAIRDKTSSAFEDLLTVVDAVLDQAFGTSRRALDAGSDDRSKFMQRCKLMPSTLSTLILDSLLYVAHSRYAVGDTVAAQMLMDVFSASVEPLWFMAGDWIRKGALAMDSNAHASTKTVLFTGSELEFFIQDNHVPLMEPHYWAEGHTLRRKDESDGFIVPRVFRSVADIVVGAGKAVGLLRAFDVSIWAHEDNPTTRWESFSDSLSTTSMSVTSMDDFVSERLSHHCVSAPKQLRSVLINDCDLWGHLLAIEDVFLMRRGDAMSHFCDNLFTLMDSRQSWSDFHNLNTAFRNVAESSSQPWIQSSRVRLTYRVSASRERDINRTTRAIDGLTIEYSLPFPLGYFCGPAAFETYNGVFLFLLKMRRAKATLDHILVRGTLWGRGGENGRNLKAFYAMRSRLSWFVNLLLNFITTNVLHPQLSSFHAALKQTHSLDEMIEVHNDHLSKIKGRCLLQPNTSAVHRAIVSVLDMCIHFNAALSAFIGGNATHDASQSSVVLSRRHRSRRQKRIKRNVVGFSHSEVEDPDSDSDEDDEVENDERRSTLLSESAQESASFLDASSLADADASVSISVDSFSAHINKMYTDLDALVRFTRRSVESLALNAGEAAAAFGILAFALEEWDL